MPSLASVLPIFGPSPVMHDCKHKDIRRFNTVENPKRKPIDETAANVFFYDRPGMWMSDDVLNCREDFEKEIVAEAGLTILIIVNSCTELFLGFGVEREGHFSKRLRILANTSLPGMVFN